MPRINIFMRRFIHAGRGFGQLRMHIYCYNNSRTVNHAGKRAHYNLILRYNCTVNNGRHHNAP